MRDTLEQVDFITQLTVDNWVIKSYFYYVCIRFLCF